MFVCLLQERGRELVSHNASSLGQIGTSIGTAVSTSSFSSAPRLSHTPSNDFQPPYFPPPAGHAMPQQPIDIYQPHPINAEPYGFSSLHPAQQHYSGLQQSGRSFGTREDETHLFRSVPSLSGNPYDTRHHYDVRRPDILMQTGTMTLPSRTSDMHSSNMPTFEENEVS